MNCRTCGQEFKTYFYERVRCSDCGILTYVGGEQPEPTVECVYCERTFDCTDGLTCPWCLNEPGHNMDAFVARAITKRSLRVV